MICLLIWRPEVQAQRAKPVGLRKVPSFKFQTTMFLFCHRIVEREGKQVFLTLVRAAILLVEAPTPGLL